MNQLGWLTLGAFAIGTEGFMIAGLLPRIARDLGVSLAAAGLLVTVFSLVYAVGAPVIAVLTAGLERRRLLVVGMGCFGIANFVAALAPGYDGLLIARLLLALAAACFMPAASGYAAAYGRPAERGRALSMVMIGLTLAIIAGAPLGVLIGEEFGWRATFLAVAGLSVLSLIGIIVRLPPLRPGASHGWRDRLALAKRRETLSILATSVLTVAGTFTVYTYLGPFLAGAIGTGPRELALWLLGFGVASAFGSRVGGAASDRLGARLTVALCGVLALIAYTVLWLGAAIGPPGAIVLVLPAVLLWGLATWALMTAQQARLVAIHPTLASVSLSLNSSAIYFGGAIGSAIGALVVQNTGAGRLGLVAAGFSIAALFPLWAGSGAPPSKPSS